MAKALHPPPPPQTGLETVEQARAVHQEKKAFAAIKYATKRQTFQGGVRTLHDAGGYEKGRV
ncbi:hypothetical protein GQ53DRAFT_832390 [Thozetella sp. PMI_491]|nr:hypothetical protein GQ53DRAFT_832390 [Thozetella sp. PMI_491]